MYISAYILQIIIGLDVFRFIDSFYFLHIFKNNVNIVGLMFLLFLLSTQYFYYSS